MMHKCFQKQNLKSFESICYHQNYTTEHKFGFICVLIGGTATPHVLNVLLEFSHTVRSL